MLSVLYSHILAVMMWLFPTLALCEDEFCARCENSPLECSQCQTGYTLDMDARAGSTKCLHPESERLDNIIIIGTSHLFNLKT